MKLPFLSLSSIGTRVNLVFAVISSIMMAAMMMSWMAFEELGGQIDEINEVRVPSLSKTINLFGIADDFLNLGPSMSHVKTEKERQSLYARMTDHLARLKKLSDFESNQHKISGLVGNLSTSLALLNSSAKYRLRLEKERTRQLEYLNDRYRLFQTALERLVNQQGTLKTFLDIERTGRDIFDNLLYLEQVHQPEKIRSIAEELKNLSKALKRKAGEISSTFLSQTENFLDVLSLPENLLSLHRHKLSSLAESAHELENARVKIIQLRLILTLNVKGTQDAIEKSSMEARNLIKTRTAQLALSVASVFIVSFFASFIFVHRSLVRRLTMLEDQMKSIAHGKLDTVIDTRGNDEISRMADALEVFRKTAREVEEQQTRAIIESSVAGLVMTDGEGHIEFLSHTARTLFGYEDSSLHQDTQRKINDLVVEEEGEPLSAMLAACKAKLNKESYDTELKNIREFKARRYDQSTFPSDIAVRGIQQRSGQKFIFTIYDVTERKLAHEHLEQTVQERTAELRQTNKELELENKTRLEAEKMLRNTKEELIQASKLAALGKMASGISHEFNQPLMAVASWLHNVSLLIEQGEMGEADEALKNIETQVNRMMELASHLQTLARQPNLNFAPVSIADILERSLSLFDVRLKQEGATVYHPLPSEDVVIVSDALRLEQVFINLIANALDAMCAQEAKTLSLSLAMQKHDHVSIKFSDNGPGVPADIIDHVFDPFFTTKEVGKGMGLGLSISYNIARTLGGSLTVSNLENGGACFNVTLPRDATDMKQPLQAEEIW